MKAGQPSRTALVVAGGLVYASRVPTLSGLVDPDAALLTRQLLMADAGGRRLIRLIDGRSGRAMLRWLECCTIPGMIQHWACRKRWIDAAWRAARNDGFDTVVTLGSGFDTLSLRAGRLEPDSVRTVDLDHPATLGVRRAGAAPLLPASHRFIEHDLSLPGVDGLLTKAIDPARSAFIVIEGVLMYLDAARVAALFDELALVPISRMRIAMTFMESRQGSFPAFRPRSRLVDLWLRWRGEPFRSGLDPDGLSTWLATRGFRLLDRCATPGRPDERLCRLRGEWAALAERTR